ncbi:MAG: bifunctional demethylmenaquinone methyltransferase/2-methoxy-6-polyprenyl-1,4-benzoquinol methylase UbiE [Arcobacter sp.]|nr:MAG: bifunctional demethylmenaquinone methyltransferase/2-methoxy-6-polyprenyl-1,4-benzoquinol methylase UbiE [Arcobacter sp.]
MAIENQEKIVEMFNDIAPTYDRANRILSMGIDKTWRKKGCDLAYDMKGDKEIDLILDIACGTGDMMDYWMKRASKHGINVKKILGVDPSDGMVDVARGKFPKFDYAISKATEIPVEDASADFLSISYGIRNVVEREKALIEFNRVLKPGGYVVILEFMKRENPGVLAKFTDFYLNNILPKIGGAISNNKEAYEYLPNSIEGFLTLDKMEKELEGAGFEVRYSKSFSMNISSLIIAKKI